MASWLYVNGEGILCANEEEAHAKLVAMIKALENQGYKRKQHHAEPDRALLAHETKGAVYAYVHDEAPPARDPD